jgi:putative Holliday junction resolvase
VSGRLLAFDYGTVRIGLAICDVDQRIASPLATYRRQGRDRDSSFFRALVQTYEASALLVGLPIHLSGHEGQKAVEARAFGRWLRELTGLPVLFWDERFTSVTAEQTLLAAGLTNKRRKARRDRVAAQILLQSYLDAGCPPEMEGGPLEGGQA